MTKPVHLDGFQAYLLAEDRSRVTIAGYIGDVRLFAQWIQKHYGETLTPDNLIRRTVLTTSPLSSGLPCFAYILVLFISPLLVYQLF
jgi:hypothetical protein